MAHTKDNQRSSQLVCAIAFVAILTHVLGFVQAGSAGSNQPSESAAASTQPLWSYQVKPNNYGSTGSAGHGQVGAYSMSGPASIFDAFTGGLSQRQGALTSSPFLSILPIILIAAGGLLLLLPMLTMMMASPFGGGAFGGGGYQNYGYPQVSGLNKRRSLDSPPSGPLGSHRGIIELIEHVSSTIEDLSRKYAPIGAQQAPAPSGGAAADRQHSATAQSGSTNKRSARALNGAANLVQPQPANHQPASANEVLQPANHKPAASNGE